MRPAASILSIFSLVLLSSLLSFRGSNGALVAPKPNSKLEEENKNEEEYDKKKSEEEKPKVILILIDGVRWDYIRRDSTLKGFNKLAKNGVRAQHVQPVFPANSYPNWYSIATGLYPESHGFIQNKMFNGTSGDFFLMLPDAKSKDPRWWNKAEPFWILSERNDLRSALYWWGGCHVAFDKIKATECLEHDGWDTPDKDVREKLYASLKKLDTGELDFLGLYYGAVDHYGHKKGPDAPETKKALASFDEILLELQNNLTREGLDDEVNLMVVSDHGMTKTGPKDVHFLSLELFADDIKYQLNYGSSSMILPEEGREEKLFEDLFRADINGVLLYKKENIPENLHIRKNPLVLPIWIQAKKGFYIMPLNDELKTMTPSNEISLGSHGYDPNHVEDMMTIFYAKGPAFKKNFVSPPLENVDYYNLLCHIFDIKGNPNNGSMERIMELLGDDADDDDEDEDDDEDGGNEDDNDDEDDDNSDEKGDTDRAPLVHISAAAILFSLVLNL